MYFGIYKHKPDLSLKLASMKEICIFSVICKIPLWSHLLLISSFNPKVSVPQHWKVFINMKFFYSITDFLSDDKLVSTTK